MFDACGGRTQKVSTEHGRALTSSPQQQRHKTRWCAVSVWTQHRLLTHCFQVVFHDVPGGLHHLEHHVVLDVLHKVEHALTQGECSSKPEQRLFKQNV